METLTIAAIVTFTLSGALQKLGEQGLEGTQKLLGQLIKQKFPTIWQQITGNNNEQEALPEVIQSMREAIESDEEIKATAEKLAQENQSNQEVINITNNFIKNAGVVNQGIMNNNKFNFD